MIMEGLGVQRLSRDRRPHDIAVSDLSFRHRRRETLFSALDVILPAGRTVILGPNGAGKTTLLGLISGGLRPQAGRIVVDGSECTTQELRRTVALMPQRIRPLSGLNVLEQVTYSGWLAGQPARQARTAAEEALARTGLSALSGKRPGRISGGEVRRLGLAQALATRSQHLLLDEPTAGLDPEQRYNFRAVLASLPDEMCVVVSTHDVADVEEMYDHVVVISGGSVRFSGTTSDFLSIAPQRDSHRSESAYLDLVASDRS